MYIQIECPLLIALFIFFIIELCSSYILDTSLCMDIICKHFSHSISYLFILLIMFFDVQVFNFDVASFFFFFLCRGSHFPVSLNVT